MDFEWHGPSDTSKLFLRGPERNELSPAERQAVLDDVRAGRDRRLNVDAVVFRQGDGPNRNFIRFKAGMLRALAKSFVGVPFLRDHERRDLSARGGRVIASEFVGGEGTGEIHQTFELSAPWAVDAIGRGLIDRFSIGWSNTENVLCSECEAPFRLSFFGPMPGCEHMPGDTVDVRGGGKRVVEMLVTGAEALETSAVLVPAVSGTGIDAIRAALSAHRSGALPPRKKHFMSTKIALALGFTDEADEDKLAAAVTDQRNKLAAVTAQNAELATSLATAQGKLATLEGETKAQRTDALIEQAKRDGKLLPKLDAAGKPTVTELETTLRAMAGASYEGAAAFIGQMPRVGPSSTLQSDRRAPKEERAIDVLSAEEKARCKRLGITEANFLAAKAEIYANQETDEDKE